MYIRSQDREKLYRLGGNYACVEYGSVTKRAKKGQEPKETHRIFISDGVLEEIGTYETSILPYEDCCTIFVPEHPVINPEKELAREYEEKFDYNALIKEAIKTKETITLPRKEEEFDNIL